MRLFLPSICFVLFAAFATSCEEVFEEDEANAPDQYFECDVKGAEIEATLMGERCGGPVFNYFPEAVADVSPGFMLIGSEQCNDTPVMLFTFQGVNPEYTGTSSLENLDFADSFKPSFRSLDGVVYNRFIDGSWRVTQFSSSTKKGVGRIAGTFDMRLIDFEKTDTLEVKNGRFSFNIPRIRE